MNSLARILLQYFIVYFVCFTHLISSFNDNIPNPAANIELGNYIRPEILNTPNIPTTSSLLTTQAKKRIFRKNMLPDMIDKNGNLEVYHLRSFPMLLIDSDAGKFMIQTSGLALRSTVSRKVLVLEYSPFNYSACFLPIVRNISGFTKLVWDKRSIITYLEVLDINYWQQSTFLSLINNVVYENFINWVDKYMRRRNIFIPQSVCSTSDESTCFTQSQTWDTFLSDSFDALSQLAVQMRAIIPPRGSDMLFISNTEPEVFSEANLIRSPSNNTKHRSPKRRKHRFDNNQKIQPHRSMSSAQLNTNGLRARNLIYLESRRKPNPVEVMSDIEDNTGERPSSEPTELPTEMPFIYSNNVTIVWNINTTLVNGTFQSTNNTDDGFADLANELIDNGNNFKAKNLSSVTRADVNEYYIDLLACMQEYQLEDFTSAYKSCLHDESSFIHINEDLYYHVNPRYPYLHVNEYLHDIPSARVIERSSSDIFDFTIFFALIGFALTGLIVGAYKLDMAAWCWHKTASIRRRRVSMAPPVEGGYSLSSSELPVYKSLGEIITGSANKPSKEIELRDRYKGLFVPRLFGGGGGLGDYFTSKENKSIYRDHSIIENYESIVNFGDGPGVENRSTIDFTGRQFERDENIWGKHVQYKDWEDEVKDSSPK